MQMIFCMCSSCNEYFFWAGICYGHSSYMPSASLTSSVTANVPTIDFGYYAGDTSGPDGDGYHTCAMVME